MSPNQFTAPWTDSEKAKVREYAAAGLTSGEIVQKFEGRTRNSVCGLAMRMGIKLMGPNGGNTNRKGKRYGPRQPASNVVPFKPKPKPKPKPIRPEYKALKPAPKPAPVKLSVVSNNVPLMVQDWIAKNGGPRRFERGESGDYWSVRAFLEDRGYSLNGHQAKHKVSKGGQSRLMVWRDVVAIADQIREAEGLLPLKARAHG